MRTSMICLTAVAPLLAVTAQATPVLIANASQSAVYTRDCRSDAARAAGSSVPDMCEMAPGGANYANTMREAVYTTALGGLSSAARATSPLAIAGDQVSRASADVSTGLGALVVKQGAFSGTSYSRVSAWNTVLQSYGWDGSGSASRHISANLDFSVLSPVDFDNAALGASASIQASVSVFSLSTSSFVVDTDSFDGSNTFEPFATSAAGYRSEGYAFTQLLDGTSADLGLDFTMELGRNYFVELQLGTWGRFGGYLDATHTFTAEFDDAEGLSAAAALDAPIVISSTVPEPTGMGLLGVGLLALASQRRRRQTR